MKQLIVITLITILFSSCMSSKYYKGCDGKKKWKTQMHY